jgi:hypothetical protein
MSSKKHPQNLPFPKVIRAIPSSNFLKQQVLLFGYKFVIFFMIGNPFKVGHSGRAKPLDPYKAPPSHGLREPKELFALKEI